MPEPDDQLDLTGDLDDADLEAGETETGDLPSDEPGAIHLGPGDEDEDGEGAEPDLGVAVERYPEGRPLTDRERRHPLAESGWKVVAASSLDGDVDALFIEKGGHRRLVELYDEYAWAKERRRRSWEEFLLEQAHYDDRAHWAEALQDKLALFGVIDPAPAVYVARNEEYGADWILGLEV